MKIISFIVIILTFALMSISYAEDEIIYYYSSMEHAGNAYTLKVEEIRRDISWGARNSRDMYYFIRTYSEELYLFYYNIPCDDFDEDGLCDDQCLDDPNKTEPGECGCGTPDIDTDGDGILDCFDECPLDPNPDCADECPDDPDKAEPGECGCGIPDTDSDGDNILDCFDECPLNPNPYCDDECPDDPNKMIPGSCGCGIPDTDTDGDGIPDCIDECPLNPNPDCDDECPDDPNKTDPGLCGCGIPDADTDDDGIPDCDDKDNGDDNSCDASKQGNPIRIYNGNKIESESDILFTSSFSGGFVFKRFYNSRSMNNWPTGFGWTHNYNVKMYIENSLSSSIIKILDGTERGIYFQQNGLIYEGMNKELAHIENDNNKYTWNRPDNKKYTFDDTGKLLKIGDANGNLQMLSYSADNLLETVTDEASGRVLTFHYDSKSRIVNITGPVTDNVSDGIWVNYEYNDVTDNLESVIYADGSGYHYSYTDTNDVNNLTEKRDALNHFISGWSYDEYDRAYESINRDGKNIIIDYSNPDQIETTDPTNGVIKTFSISEIAGRKKITHVSAETVCSSCGSDVLRYEYDADRNIIEKEYVNGRIDKYLSYDERNNYLYKVEWADTEKETVYEYEYHPVLNEKTYSKEPSIFESYYKETILDYDNDSNDIPNESPTNLLHKLIVKGYTKDVTGNIVPYENKTKYQYDSNGLLISEDGPQEGTTDKNTFTYYSNGDLETSSNEVAGTTTYTYDNAGNVKTVTDIYNQVASFTYDGKNRQLTSERNGIGSSVSYTLSGDIHKSTDAKSNETEYIYDAQFGRLEKIVTSEGNYQQYSYDNNGNKTESSIYSADDQRQTHKEFDYSGTDFPGKLWKVINPDGTYTEYSYDSYGNQSSVKDPSDKLTDYEYNVENQLVKVIKPGDITTSYTYDLSGNLETVTDANGNITEYEYDDASRVIKETSPDSGTTTYTYDASGNMKTKTPNSGEVTIYEYDGLGRLVQMIYEDQTQNVTMTYDEGVHGKGRLTSKSSPGYSYTYEYNDLGNMVKEEKTIDSITYTTEYAYDSTGILTSMTYPDGRIVSFGQNTLGQYSSVSTVKGSTEQILADSISYKPFGPMVSMTYGNGLTHTKNYDQSYRISEIKADTIHDLEYALDPSGNIESITNYLDQTKNKNFIYDDQYQLKSAEQADENILYTYDSVGNRLTKTDGNETEIYSYIDGTNKLETVKGDERKLFIYNENGSVEKTIEVNEPDNGKKPDYLYNIDGQRIKKTVDGISILYHYDLSGNLIQETDSLGNLIKSYVFFAGSPLAQIDSTGNVCYYHNDHLGTPQKMTNMSGSVVWSAEYTPFGQATVETEVVENNLRFPGQYYDFETGLHFNNYRYYDPETGRYLRSDPIGLDGGINLYTYVQGNPINLIDTLGLSATLNPYSPSTIKKFEALMISGNYQQALEWARFMVLGAQYINSAQRAIEREANRREYKNRCNEPPPPGLTDPCERAKWKLKKAQDCKKLRQAFTNRWYGGKPDQAHKDHIQQVDKQIKNEGKAIRNSCKDPCD